MNEEETGYVKPRKGTYRRMKEPRNSMSNQSVKNTGISLSAKSRRQLEAS